MMMMMLTTMTMMIMMNMVVLMIMVILMIMMPYSVQSKSMSRYKDSERQARGALCLKS